MKTLNKLSLLIIVVALAACSDKQAKLEELKAKQKEIANEIKALEKELGANNTSVSKVKTKDVMATELKSGPFQYVLQTQGGVEAEENILVSAKTTGIVTSVFVKEGQNVVAGQILAQVDNSVNEKTIEEVKNNLVLANTVYERQKNLWEQKIGTEVQYLTTKNAKESLEKRLATLHEQSEMSKIKSQISGTVEDVMAKVGESASPQAPAFRILGSKNLKVVAPVSEAYVSQIKAGNAAQVEFLDQNKKFDGRVMFVGKNINPLSRTFSVEIPIPAGMDARPNMSATVRIIFNTVPSALAVPVNVVQSINNQKIVYIAEESEGKMIARKRIVEVGGIYNNLAEIKTGLKVGDKIITFGFQGLNDGEAVKI